MFCGNCGRKFKDNESYCTYCGKEKVIPTVKIDPKSLPPQIVQSPKNVSVKYKSFSSTILVGIFGFFLVVFWLGCFYLQIVNSQEYEFDYTQKYSTVRVGDVFVPTLAKLIDGYELCVGGEDSLDKKTVSYCDENLTDTVLNKYLDVLIDEYGYKEDKNLGDVRSVIFVDEKYPEYTVVVEVDFSEKVINYYKYDNDDGSEIIDDKNENDENSENIEDSVIDKDDINVLQ